jgi:dihydroorotate dehydrogenase
MYTFFKKMAFKMDAEKAHHLGLKSLNLLNGLGLSSRFSSGLTEKPVEVFGIRFPNPVGLAAGLDKDGICVDALGSLGFGFLEIGTVTPRPQPGNEKPRLFRIPESEAIINRMGFNNQGVEALVGRVKNRSFKGILGINLGKNFDTPLEGAAEDYAKGLRAVYPVADYVTINISSPNTAGLRDLQSATWLSGLLEKLRQERVALSDQHEKKVPLLVKIAPDLDTEEIKSVSDLLV